MKNKFKTWFGRKVAPVVPNVVPHRKGYANARPIFEPMHGPNYPEIVKARKAKLAEMGVKIYNF